MNSNINFTTPDPYAFLASAGSFDAQDIFGPPASTLDAAYDGYPTSVAQNYAETAATGGGPAPWYAREELHALAAMVLGGWMIHQFLQS